MPGCPSNSSCARCVISPWPLELEAVERTWCVSFRLDKAKGVTAIFTGRRWGLTDKGVRHRTAG
jgi:hypothetical protein